MNNKTKAGNLTRAFNMAATLFTNPTIDLSDGAPADIAGSLGELAAALYSEQNALFEGEDLETVEAAPAKKSGGWSGGGGGGGGSASDKQVNFAQTLITEIQGLEGNPDVDIADVKGMTVGDASDAITKLIEQRDALQ